jgi:predicted HTH transcriptional regulator
MKKKEKFYQILSNNFIINGITKVKQSIVYYDAFGVEELKESYDSDTKIKEGYIPLHMTLDVPIEYEPLNKEIKNLYLSVITNENGLDTEGNLNQTGKENLKKEIRHLYSKKISNIIGLQEYLERNTFDSTPIPQEIIESRNVLKLEYHNLINFLGL